MNLLRRPEGWVFALLLGSYAYFWHARDWNTASRLMLTYALGDRGTVRIDGLDRQTGDIAYHEHHYYSDKLPGYSLVGLPIYLVARHAFGLPPHPLDRPGMTHWPADYWVTLGTSGLATALAGALLARLAVGLGCGPRRAALVGLAYGLATPAYSYATLAYGHQVAACFLLTSFALLRRDGRSRRDNAGAFLAGALASWAAVVELPMGPVAAVLGFFLLARVIGRHRPPAALGTFAVGAALPAVVLLSYNQLAFGSPWDMGYFHERLQIFNRVHNAANPLGLRPPDWSLAPALLWGGHRGLFFYAPILLLAPFGGVALAVRRHWGTVAVSVAACLAIFVVNLSYPEWTGGWSTGPRLLVPLIPFAMLPVAGLFAVARRSWVIALGLALIGGIVNLLFQGVGARLPQDVADPLMSVVWPLWRGDPVPPWREGARFDRTVLAWLWPGAPWRGRPAWNWLEYAPLLLMQVTAAALAARALSPPVSKAQELADGDAAIE